jgi:hypothetical protein
VSPWPVSVIAVAYLAAHLPFIAPSLEDHDSMNFALGLRDFNPALHQPHPPGYPVYIALGRALLLVISAVRPALSRVAAEALTLGLWSVVAGTVAIVAAARVLTLIAPSHHRTVLWAIALLAVSPLFWLSGLRPMSDLPGLALAIVAQALILHGRTDRRRLVQGAFIAGLAAGIRVQTVWLTLPLMVFVIIELLRSVRGAGPVGPAEIRRFTLRPIAALAVGALIWAAPLVMDSGGIDGYLRALGTQAGEDFAWVNMLWLEPTPRRLMFALYETFVLPWGSTPLAAVVAVLATIGVLLMLLRERAALGLLLVAFVPYIVFHMLFHATLEVRYALPTLPLVAWFAARGLNAAGRFTPFVAAPLIAAAVAVAAPVGVAYGREPHPAFRAIADASRRAAGSPPAAVYSHESIWRALQADSGGLPVVAPQRRYEWLGPVEYWKKGGRAPIWFLADPRRTDLALIDPQARVDVVRYRWEVAGRPELGGSRPLGTDWFRIQPPGWFAGQGWSLTPEVGGLTRATGMGPDQRPIEAWVRRREEPLHLVVGGRHLGNPGDPDAEFELAIDGMVRDRWTLTVGERNFLRFLDLPGGIAAGAGDYAPLTIVSRGTRPGTGPPVGVRQFDIQPANQMLYGFAEGWHEEEYDPITGQRWRWTSDRSVIRVKGAAGGIRITMRGESPLRYFDAPPQVRVTVPGQVLAELHPDADFEWTVIVPAGAISEAAGAIAIETDRIYLPGQAEGTADERRLGLRLYDCLVAPVPP